MTYPFPFGLALTLPPPLPVPSRIDLKDPAQGTVSSARRIDPISRDFALQNNGLYQGMNEVEQIVLLSISTTFNSSALQNFGQNFGSVKVISPYIKKQISSLLNQCLGTLLAANLITLSAISVTADQLGRVFLNFSFTNTTLKTTTPVHFQLPGT